MEAGRILRSLSGDRHVFHADFLAVVDERRTAQGEQQHGGHASPLRSSPVPVVPADEAGDIVVAGHIGRPRSSRETGLQAVNDVADGRRLPGRVSGDAVLTDEVEVEGEMEAVERVAAVEAAQRGWIAERLTDRHPFGELVEHAPDLAHRIEDLRPVAIVDVILFPRLSPAGCRRWIRTGWVVA